MKKSKWLNAGDLIFICPRKIMMKMKLTSLFMLIGIIQVAALNSYSQTSRLTMELGNVSVVEVLSIIENKSDYYFVYNKDVIDVERKVNLNVKELEIKEILDKIFENTDVSYKIMDHHIILTSINAAQSQVKVSGKITNTSGEAIPGVAIMVKGTTNGTISDTDGKYTLSNVPSDDILQFSFVGMKPLEIAVSGQNSISVEMEEETIGLEEVVAIGYGSIKKKDLTSSITTVTPEKLNKGVIRDPVLALQGKVPGLSITKDGSPYGSASIHLRGPSTLRGAGAEQPFFIVDGMPNAIMPAMDDIASIDILRDASATAIYGSRAANGVIIITTKRGKANNQIISYNGYIGLESVSNKIDMLSADEYRKYISDNGRNLSPDDEQGANNNWQDIMTKNSLSYKNNLSISGGNNKTTYIASVEHYRNEGIIIGTNFERLNMRAQVEQYGFNDKLKLQFQVGGQIAESEKLIDLEEVLGNMLQYQPTRKIKNEDGSFAERAESPYNPVALVEQHDNDGKTKNIFGNIRADLNVLKGLDFTVNTSWNNSQSLSSVYYSKLSRLAQGLNGYAVRNAYESETKLIETYASYKAEIEKHNFTFLAGYSWEESMSGSGFQSSNTNFITDYVSYYNLGLGSGSSGYVVDYGTTTIRKSRMISFYGRLNYEFNDKYLLQVTIRRDGSSAFGENERWGMFPSTSVAWRLMEEPFIQKLNAFSNLKLRAGYGTSGNAMGFDPLISIMRYGDGGSFYYQGKWITGITPTQNANPDLRWERTDMLNIGIDFGILNEKIRGTVEYYDKITKGMIWVYAVPATQYYVNSILANVGEMENKGWEVSLSAIPFKSKNLSWETSFNVSFNKNEVNSLSNDIFQQDYIDYYGVGQHGQSGNYAFRIQEGYPIGQYCLWEYRGENADGISQFTDVDDSDADGDGVTINPSSLDRIMTKESAQPKATGGWQNTITYRNFGLDFLLRGVTGNYILNSTRADLNYPAEILRYNVTKETLNEPINNIRSNYTSTRYLEKGDYIRLDNITLSYTPELTSKYIKKLTLYSTVNNAFVITKYKGIDPEVNMGGLSPGIDDRNFYPKTRSFIFGVNVEF